jgi:translation initiation factor 2 beta subunit (eIF-2beta)/eIF-5
MEFGGSASGLVNIGGGGDDAHYRYKMPRILGKIEGRGNGIKTRIVNCSQIAKALHRPPGYVCKFFGCELGAQTKIDDDEDVYIVNGAHDQKLLSDTLDKFVRMYVLCPNCKMPETDLVLDKRGNIYHACNACGAQHLVDMSHRVVTYMLNNPPDGGKSKKSGKSKKERKESKKKKNASNANGEHEENEDGDGELGSGLDGKTKKKKSSKRREGETEEAYRERRAAEKAARRLERAAQKAGEASRSPPNGVEELVTSTDLEALAREAEAASAALHQRHGHNHPGNQADSDLDHSSHEDREILSRRANRPSSSMHESNGRLQDNDALEYAPQNGDHDSLENDDDDDDDDDDTWDAGTSEKTAHAKEAAQRAAALLERSHNSFDAGQEETELTQATGAISSLHVALHSSDHGFGNQCSEDQKQARLEEWLRQGPKSGAMIATEASSLFANDRTKAAKAIFRAIVTHGVHPRSKSDESPARHAIHAVAALKLFTLDREQQLGLLDALTELAVADESLADPAATPVTSTLLRTRLNAIPHILKLFYDEDILDENVIIEWYARTSDKSKDGASERIRRAAQPVVEWLQQPSEEDSSAE